MNRIDSVRYLDKQGDSVSHLDEQGYASSCKSSKSRGAKDNCEEEEEVGGGDQDQDGASPNSHKHFFPYMGSCASIVG